ncbi:MAG: hypothetical protein IPH58_17295 [Sphingobacteriales bacterium]|jgi:hypothetical protein|nr:hypothetical protein [Sphingobacteriales bacterium]
MKTYIISSFLAVAVFSFISNAQQNRSAQSIINTTKSNTKDRTIANTDTTRPDPKEALKGWDYKEKGNSKTTNRINSVNSGMPNRISMNITVGKQTQGATFGEKVASGLQSAGGNIRIVLLNDDKGAVLFPESQGYMFLLNDKTIKELTPMEYKEIVSPRESSSGQATGKMVRNGVATGAGAAAGAAFSGASIISSVISSSSVAGITGGAVAGRTANLLTETKDGNGKADLVDGDYVLEFVVEKVIEKATSGLKDTLQTQVRIAFSSVNNVLKTKHDSIKNSIQNIR